MKDGRPEVGGQCETSLCHAHMGIVTDAEAMQCATTLGQGDLPAPLPSLGPLRQSAQVYSQVHKGRPVDTAPLAPKAEWQDISQGVEHQGEAGPEFTPFSSPLPVFHPRGRNTPSELAPGTVGAGPHCGSYSLLDKCERSNLGSCGRDPQPVCSAAG